MNLFFVYGDTPASTPALTGTLLPGITRDSILTLAPDLGLTGRGGPHLDRGVAGGLRVRRAHRGLRLRHRGGDDPGRLGQGRRPRLDDRRRHPGPVTLADPRGTRGHPVRLPPRPAQLGPQDLLEASHTTSA